jgi:hypothetical protein
LRKSPLSEAASRFGHAGPSRILSHRPGYGVESGGAYSCIYRESHRFKLVVVAYSWLKDDTFLQRLSGFLTSCDSNIFLIVLNNLNLTLYDSLISDKSTTCCPKDLMVWRASMQRCKEECKLKTGLGWKPVKIAVRSIRRPGMTESFAALRDLARLPTRRPRPVTYRVNRLLTDLCSIRNMTYKWNT